MPVTAEVARDLPARLRKAAAAVADTRKAYQLALQQRDEIIVEAIDEHDMSQIKVAELAGVAKGRINPILAKAGADDDE
jgi:predicted XRE-type DNA-binding protein